MSLRKGKKLERAFYLRDTITVARELLGKNLIRIYRDKSLQGKIVEVEAYTQNDPASHSYNGKTKRNEVMFYQGGHLYVYFTYGMHYCCNVVTEAEGSGCAVLIRAIEPVENIEIMKRLRNWNKEKKIYNLTNGPAKVCQALEITKKENGTDLCGDKIFIIDTNEKVFLEDIGVSSRIGIRNGVNHKWRFFLKNSPWISKTKI